MNADQLPHCRYVYPIRIVPPDDSDLPRHYHYRALVNPIDSPRNRSLDEFRNAILSIVSDPPVNIVERRRFVHAVNHRCRAECGSLAEISDVGLLGADRG
jgi:hypothetical protein